MNGQHSVLIVDRSQETREVLQTALERRGVRTLAAGASATGLRLARQHQPDLIVLDLEIEDPSADQFSAPSFGADTACGVCGVCGAGVSPAIGGTGISPAVGGACGAGVSPAIGGAGGTPTPQNTAYQPRLVLLGNLRGWRERVPSGEFVAKPYHYGPLIRKIEELLASDRQIDSEIAGS